MAKAKQIANLNCDAPSVNAIHRVVITRLDEMTALREKALDWSNPDGVHDMRVASRRLRSVLQDFMPYLRKRRISSSVKAIKAMAAALGKVRDQDVAITALETLTTKATVAVSPGIQTLAEVRQPTRNKARAKLNSVLDQDRLVQFRADFLTAFEASLTPARRRGKPGPSADVAHDPSYRDVARATILNRLEEFEKLSDSLYHPLKAKPLHKMRLAAKRLRYALELFDECWGNSLAVFAKKISKLQSALGELHDCDVWIADFGNDLCNPTKQPAARRVATEHDIAAAWLLAYFVRLRTKHFRNALRRWREWITEDFSGQLRKIVQMDSSPQGSDELPEGDQSLALPVRNTKNTLQFPTLPGQKSA